MYDHNQLEIPDAFAALYLSPGGHRPTATRAVVTARYEFCEDLANHLGEYARTQQHQFDLSEAEVLLRCHAGLAGGAAGVNPGEAGWVIQRLAEIEGWACPELPPPA